MTRAITTEKEMATIEIKNKRTREIIFSYTKDENNVDLNEANLNEANLNEANLNEANLHEANLNEANLYRANLYRANLYKANLHGTIGNMREVCSMQIEDFPITFTKDVLQIGCKNYTHEQWRAFTDDEIFVMHGQALPFWKKWKDHIFKTIELKYGGLK